MNDQARSRLVLWGAIWLLASLLPWSALAMPFGEAVITLPDSAATINGWHGTLTLLHVIVPNWFAVVAVLAAVSYAFVAGSRAATVLTVATGYALIHLVVVLVVATGNAGTIGFGTILGILSNVALLSMGLKMLGSR